MIGSVVKPAIANLYRWSRNLVEPHFYRLAPTDVGRRAVIPLWSEVLKPMIEHEDQVKRFYTLFKNERKREFNNLVKGITKEEYNKMVDILYESTLKNQKYTPEELKQLGATDRMINLYNFFDRFFKNDIEEYQIKALQQSGLPKKVIDDFTYKWRELVARRKFMFPIRRYGDFGLHVSVEDAKGRLHTIYNTASDSLDEIKQIIRNIENGILPEDAISYASELAKKKRGISLENLTEKVKVVPVNARKNVPLPQLLTRKDLYDERVARRVIESKLFARENISLVDHLPAIAEVLDRIGVDDELRSQIIREAGEQYLHIYAKGAWARRAGVPGFSREWDKAFLEYLDTVPKSFAKKTMLKQYLLQDMEALSRKYPQYLPIARNIYEWALGRRFMSPSGLAVTSAVYTMTLGLKASFALLNLSQRLAATVWDAIRTAHYLGLSPSDALKALAKAQADELKLVAHAIKEWDWMKGLKAAELDNDVKQFLERMFLSGVIDQTFYELSGVRNKVMKIINLFPALSEKSNRIHASLTYYYLADMAKRVGKSVISDLDNFAVSGVYRTQFLYSPTNRPDFAREFLGSRFLAQVMFMYKTFIMNYIHFLASLAVGDKKHIPSFLGALFTGLSLGGIYGFPFADVVADVVKLIYRRYDPHADYKLYELSRQIPDVVKYGVPVLAGIRGDIVWGAGELFGVAPYSVALSTYRFLRDLPDPTIEWTVKVQRIPLTTVKHIVLSWFTRDDMPRTYYGKYMITMEDVKRFPPEIRGRIMKIYSELPKTIPEDERLLYALGFSTTGLASYWDAIRIARDYTKTWSAYRKSLAVRLARAIDRGDYDEVQRLYDEMVKYDIYPTAQQVRYYLRQMREPYDVEAVTD